MTDRDRERLAGVYPPLAVAIEQKILPAMASAGRPMFVVEGVRSAERQRALYAKGRTEKGPRVTNADGVLKKSNHQVKEDGFGHAVDLAFLGAEPFSDEHPWPAFGAAAKDAGCRWGGDFVDPHTGKPMRDSPHIEM